jgi:hypothetical protein
MTTDEDQRESGLTLAPTGGGPKVNVEETIRARHAFEDNVRFLLTVAALMSDREVEIALGRLADSVRETDEGSLQKLTAGEVLHAYLALRRTGAKRQRKLRRAVGWFPAGMPESLPVESVEEYLLRAATTIRLLPKAVTSTPIPDWPSVVLDVVRGLAPD